MNSDVGSFRTHLELLEGEATASADLGVVLEGLATDDGAEETSSRARSDPRSLLLNEGVQSRNSTKPAWY